jgi:hypothetical protein
MDYTADQAWVYDNPSGHVIEIGNGATAPFNSTNSGVTLQGLIVEKFNTPALGSAVTLGSGWRVSDCEIRYNYGTATRSGDNSVLEDSYLHHHQYAGMFGGGLNAVLRGLKVTQTAIGGFNTNWESSASKFVSANGLSLTSCHIHNNAGAGVWFDIDNIYNVVQECVVEYNGVGFAQPGLGIVSEISYDIIVRRNLVQGNTNAGIVSSNTTGMESDRNIVLANGGPGGTGGIFHWSTNRGSSSAFVGSPDSALAAIAAKYGDTPGRLTKNCYSHNNQIGLPFSGGSGPNAAGIESFFPDASHPAVFDSFNNTWQNNQYLFADTVAAYEWKDHAPQYTGAQWKATVAMDSTGTWT